MKYTPKTIISLFLASLIYLFQFWIGGFSALFEIVVFTLAFSFCVMWIFFFFRMIFRVSPYIKKEYLLHIFLSISIIHSLIYILLFSFAYYQNSTSPGYLARVTLSDGDKTLVFQQMSHIATDEFYDRVRGDMIEYTASGFTVYYEGVGTGSTESLEKLQGAMGIELDGNTYKSIAKLVGMVEQDYRELFLGMTGATFRNVDIPLDRLMQIYDASTLSGVRVSPSSTPEPVSMDFSGVILSPREQQVISYLSRAMLNWMIKIDTMSLLENSAGFSDARILRVILDERNYHIADTILGDQDKKIYALYGALHFEGIFARLKQSNPKWNIVSIEKLRPY